MNIRKITSMTLFLSGIVLLFNSIVLYIVPEGRVSYWADWRYLGLTKTDWADQHITVGVLFCLAGIFHIFYNWKPIVAYMKNKAKEVKIFTGTVNISLILTVFFVIGTYFNVPPMNMILDFSESFKRAASEKYGEPPYGHAETSSLKMFTGKEGLDLQKSIELLQASGITIASQKETIKEIAKKSGKTPQQVYLIIKPATKQSPSLSGSSNSIEEFLKSPKSGLGKKKLSDLCKEYGLDLNQMLTGLDSKGIKAEANASMKEIGEANESTPMEVYEIMCEVIQEGMNK